MDIYQRELDFNNRIKAITERAEAAAKGPWRIQEWKGDTYVARPDGTALWNNEGSLDSREDGEFMAEARGDIPWLLDVIKQYQKVKQELSGENLKLMAVIDDIKANYVRKEGK